MKIVFMGTPDFALPSLRALLNSRHTLTGVVTQPDRPQGRGLRLAAPPVKRLAIENGIPVFQPERLGAASFLRELQALQADIFIVVAFRILPASVLSIPPEGTVNLHASLLPKYRGAAPIQWAIINGEKETGVTTFFIERQVDTGRIILQRRVPIGPDETAGELHDRLAETGAMVLHETVDLIGAHQARSMPQQGEPSPAPKLSKTDGRIDWTQSATAIHNRIRGLNPYPMAFTEWKGRTVRMLRSRLCPDVTPPDVPSGAVVAADKQGEVIVRTGDGCLALLSVQPEGRNRMSAGEFVRGYRISPGVRLGRSQPLSPTAET